MTDRDRATYLAYTFGKAMLQCVDLANREMKVSGDKQLIKIVKDKTKDRVSLHQAFNKMFINANKYLDSSEVEKLDDAVTELIGGLW